MDSIIEKMKLIASEEGLNLNDFKKEVETNVYCISSTMKVPSHEHASHDELFYCVKGIGIGIVDGQNIELTPGATFIAPAGKMHSLKTDNNIIVVAILIPVNRIVCHCKQVSYVDIRKAMVGGARTLEDIQKQTGAGIGCGNCTKDIQRILEMACGCNNVKVSDIVDAIESGSDSVEKIEVATGAGANCGKCKALIQNIIEIGR